MKHALFSALILLCCCTFGRAQEQKSSSKKDAYKSYRSRSSSVDDAAGLLQQARKLTAKDPKAALEKVKDALGLSIAREDVITEAQCYNLIGLINEQIGEWKLAEENYSEAYEKLRDRGTDNPELVTALRGLGNSSLKQNHYPQAIEWLQQALQMTVSSQTEIELRLNLSEAHYLSGDYPAALRDLDLKNPSRFNSKIGGPNPRIENQRIKIRAKMNDASDDANKLYENSINSVKSNQAIAPEERESLQKTKEELVDILRDQKRGADEISLRKQSIEFNTATNNMGEVARDKVELSKTLAADGQSSAALRELEGAVAIADTLHNPDTQAKAYLALAQRYEKMGRAQEALRLYRKYSEAMVEKDTIRQTQLLAKADLIRQQRDIESVTKTVALGQREERIANDMLARQRLIIYGLLLIILIIAVTSYFIYRNALASKRANQMLALKSLRNQMNPHFIFNALNSVNQFIALQDERTANKFLTELSRLMRLVLENSQEDFIPLSKEIEILSLYLGLEHYRFRDKFEYTIDTDPQLQEDSVLVPPMLIQPYIENAVWHGLRYRDTPGNLMLSIRRKAAAIVIEITDDGIGRKRSAELKTTNQKKHSSTALKNIEERISIINQVYHKGYSVAVEDLEANHGTRVVLTLPLRAS